VAAGLLLDPCPPPLRQALRERGLPHRRGDAAPDRAALYRDREDRPRQGSGRPPRRPARTCRPIVAALKPWLETQLSRIPQKSQLAEDIRYTLAHWPGLIRFLDDGTLELDTNPVENQIRPIALTRKNALFAGNETGAENWAMLASLVATCKMSGVNPVDYLADTLRAILDGHPKSRIEDLMPWRYAQPSSLAA
jgi:hypothetical protein